MPRAKKDPGMIERRGAEGWRVQLRVAGERHRHTVKGSHEDAVADAWVSESPARLSC